uniref:Zgc:172182 n=1 Tax=Neogobius melanostomus TaxID=47308 RepID=A0A8C6UNU7_9GOBI
MVMYLIVPYEWYHGTNRNANKQHMHDALENLWVFSGAEGTDIEVLRSRIDEQSTLISILKQRSDELLVRCQALQKINSELEDKITDCHKELDNERMKSETLEKRFMVLASNHEAIIVFKDEYKSHNAELKQRNQELQSENDTLFSKKLQDQEAAVQSIAQELKQLKEKYAQEENNYRYLIFCQKIFTFKLNGINVYLKIQLKNTLEKHTSKETTTRKTIEALCRERDKLLQVSVERGKLIQEKQQELEQMEIKLSEEKKLRTKAEERKCYIKISSYQI